MTDEQVGSLGAAVAGRLGTAIDVAERPRLEDLDLPAPRTSPPAALAHLCRDVVYARALHSSGRS